MTVSTTQHHHGRSKITATTMWSLHREPFLFTINNWYGYSLSKINLILKRGDLRRYYLSQTKHYFGIFTLKTQYIASCSLLWMPLSSSRNCFLKVSHILIFLASCSSYISVTPTVFRSSYGDANTLDDLSIYIYIYILNSW